jgi:predicted dehydrogenase/threonine dehydrogenase-like Zn-dependent dehydrogenase
MGKTGPPERPKSARPVPMRQLVQQLSTGEVSVVDVPPPVLHPEGLLVELRSSVISSGTERAMRKLAQQSLLGKARARPDLARKVLDQARREGIGPTISMVRDRLDAPGPVGYSAAGVVLEVGEHAAGFHPGQLVSCAGAGYANHAEIVYVPATLCAPVPEGVAAEQAAFATVGAIALHGVRQASLTPGELVVVAGLGLIGQLAVRILLAYGHPVVGVDPSTAAREDVERLGVTGLDPAGLAAGRADAVLLTAATDSSDLIAAAAVWCRDRGRIVVIGDVGLEVPRRPFYDGEVEIRFSRSYGPGRYDPDHEEGAHDYPIGYVRWTEGRNLAEILRLLAEKRLNVDDLITDRYQIDEAPAAYQRLDAGPPVRALVLAYVEGAATRPSKASPVRVPAAGEGTLSLSVCGAGLFCRKTLLPALEATGRVRWSSIASASGISAAHVAGQRNFDKTLGRGEEAATDVDAQAVVIATRHDTHAALAALGVGAGKTVFVEKPLAISPEQLADLESTPGIERVVTGFNRRFAPATRALVDALRRRIGPLVIDIRVNAGRLAAGHWSDTAEQGGRLIGEGCHFVDLACTLVGGPVRRVTAAGTGLRSPAVEDTAAIVMHFGDGSAATINYVANGSPKLAKERVEVHWDGNSGVIDDFRGWTLNLGGRVDRHKVRTQDKGHNAEIAAFVDFVGQGGISPVPFHQAAHVTRVTFAIVAALGAGNWQQLEPVAW